MDFIRAAIKGLFYDMPLASAVQLIADDVTDMLVVRLREILRWQEQAFTMTEVNILSTMVSENWLRYDILGNELKQRDVARCFLMLNQFCSKIIDDTGDEPIVRFDNLLRWHELTQYIGEDMLSTAYLAERDIILNRERTSFAWPEVMKHDNKELNALLDKGLCDVHAHLVASTDIFGSNWVALMNHVAIAEKSNGKVGIVEVLPPYQEYDIQTMNESSDLSLHHWGIVAARVRVALYMTLFVGKAFPFQRLKSMVSSKNGCVDGFYDTITEIGIACDTPQKLPDCTVFDYAISQKTLRTLTDDERFSPQMIHWGERSLLYNFFLKYFNRDELALEIAPWVYLYLLIKVKYRRELIQTNPLLGLENFQQYEHRKGKFLVKGDNLRLAFKYAVQTSIGKDNRNFFEARITPNLIGKIRMINYRTSIFDEHSFCLRKDSDKLSLVVHFLKAKPNDNVIDFQCRHVKLRRNLRKDMMSILYHYKDNKAAKEQNLPLLVGIDAAGAELNCRPEVFAPYFRWAKLEGIKNMTYHAGEDFFDLLDGIRTINEVVLFMQYGSGCRIGHGLALGVDARRYYELRHYHTVMPKQIMLDNLVWLHYKSKSYNVALEPSTQDFIEKTVMQLMAEIGYGENTSMYRYWQSMLLRGDRIRLNDDELIATFDLASECHDESCDEARKSETAKELHTIYETKSTVAIAGGRPCIYSLPKTFHLDVEKMQWAVIRELASKNICIECNPSSNIKVGPFSRYDELPMMKFLSIKPSKRPSLSVSINTDDKGVFATSLTNEYSLVAAALQKQRDSNNNLLYENKEIYDYIRRLIENAHHQRFVI